MPKSKSHRHRGAGDEQQHHTAPTHRMLRLAVFDLDYTVWQPEMYQLWGPPKLKKVNPSDGWSSSVLREARTDQSNMILMDRSDTPITVFDGASFALTEINRLQKEGFDIRAAVASRTDQPAWAETCMKHLVVQDGMTLDHCFGDLVEIDCYNDKTHHFRRLHALTNIPYSEMCFFDNEYWNIQCVSKLGVKCFYTPDGMTRAVWKDAMEAFGMDGA